MLSHHFSFDIYKRDKKYLGNPSLKCRLHFLQIKISKKIHIFYRSIHSNIENEKAVSRVRNVNFQYCMNARQRQQINV